MQDQCVTCRTCRGLWILASALELWEWVRVRCSLNLLVVHVNQSMITWDENSTTASHHLGNSCSFRRSYRVCSKYKCRPHVYLTTFTEVMKRFSLVLKPGSYYCCDCEFALFVLCSGQRIAGFNLLIRSMHPECWRLFLFLMILVWNICNSN